MERTAKYLNYIRENNGYLGFNAGWYSIQEILEKKAPGTKAEKIGSYTGYANSSDIAIYRYEVDNETRYCAELSYRTDIDDYCIATHIFDCYPSETTIKLMREINEIETKIKLHILKPEFECWECGRKIHWIDIDGTIEEKINGLMERYCGC